jgi:hypothetical protein
MEVSESCTVDLIRVEDEMIREFVKAIGTKCWVYLAKLINEKLFNGANMREAKKVRERWINHV